MFHGEAPTEEVDPSLRRNSNEAAKGAGVNNNTNRWRRRGVKLKYTCIVSGFYLLFVVAFILTYLKGMGHGPSPFNFVFFLNRPACYVLDLLPDRVKTNSALPQVLSCLLAGLVMYALLGFLIDVIVSRYRRR